MVGTHVKKMSTVMRKALPVEELAVTLRFLATGEFYRSLQYQFRIDRAAIALFVPVVCRKIYECLKDHYSYQIQRSSGKKDSIHYARKMAISKLHRCCRWKTCQHSSSNQ